MKNQHTGAKFRYYTEDGEARLTPEEKAQIKNARGIDVLHNEGAKILWSTHKEYYVADVDSRRFYLCPLGRSRNARDSAEWGVYVPTSDGGVLTVNCRGGEWSKLRKLHGAEFKSGTDIGRNNQGLFVFRVQGNNYTVSNTFVQEGRAKRKVKDEGGNWKTEEYEPWNFWYWPKTIQNPDPHLFDNPGPLTRFDDYFQHHVDPPQPGCQAFAWESDPKNQHCKSGHPKSADGHCRDGAMASAIMEEPDPANVPNGNPVGFVQEDIEGFCTEFFTAPGLNQNPGNEPVGFWTYQLVPKVGGEPGTEEAKNDSKIHWLHIALIDSLFIKNRPLVIDICGDVKSGPSSWNHACYRFTADFRQAPNPGLHISEQVRITEITTTLWYNGDFFPSDGFPSATSGPIEETAYRLNFKDNGEIARNEPLGGVTQDWQSLKRIDTQPARDAYALTAIGLLDTAYGHWTQGASGQNPEVTYERLNALKVKRNNW